MAETDSRSIEVTVLVPCHNEERTIARTLDCIIENDFPKEKLEVFVIDGGSSDQTISIVREYQKRHPWIELIENPKRIVPTALNMGIRRAKGRWIVRMDAHNHYPSDYISKCHQTILRNPVENVGGMRRILPGASTKMAQAIASALSSPFSTGSPAYLRGVPHPTPVDTVPFGCFPKEIFEKVGLFDEDMIRSQDAEFNLRILRYGGHVLLNPEIVSYYYARSTLAKLWQQFWQYGYYKPLIIKKNNRILSWRQLVPFLFLTSLSFLGLLSFYSSAAKKIFLLLLLSYLLANVLFSIQTALKSKKLELFLLLSVVFLTVHLSYGLGYLKGLGNLDSTNV